MAMPMCCPAPIATMPPARSRAVRLGKWPVACLALLASWREVARSRHALAQLDDRMLRDIGLSRDQIRSMRLF